MNIERSQSTLSGLLDKAYLEVIPTPTIIDRLVHIPRQRHVAISCSPAHGVEYTLSIVEQLRALPDERQLKLIPHISARMIQDKKHLREIMARLKDSAIESVFIPAGDRHKPIGVYKDSLQVLQDMADIGHDFRDIGVAAYPEKHPLIDTETLMRFLREKQSLASYFVTQMCFDPQALVQWLGTIREAGITLPARIGLPGVANFSRLMSLSLQIGVGQSLKQLKKQKGMFKRIASTKPYQPDDLLEGIQPFLLNEELNISRFHLFSFNDVERTENWRVNTLNNINSAKVESL